MLAGSTAGIFYWLSCYHFDTIKSKIQSDSFKNP